MVMRTLVRRLEGRLLFLSGCSYPVVLIRRLEGRLGPGLSPAVAGLRIEQAADLLRVEEPRSPVQDGPDAEQDEANYPHPVRSGLEGRHAAHLHDDADRDRPHPGEEGGGGPLPGAVHGQARQAPLLEAGKRHHDDHVPGDEYPREPPRDGRLDDVHYAVCDCDYPVYEGVLRIVDTSAPPRSV